MRKATRAVSRKNRRATRAARRRAATRRYRGGMMDYADAVSGNRMIDAAMVPASATAPLDAALAEASAMAAMSGGKRRGRKDRSRRSRSRRSRRMQRGGEQEYSAPGMLLPSAMYNDAGLNPEWREHM